MLSEIEVAKELLKINAIRLQPDDPFTWASGLKSPIYCDNRMTLSYPDLRRSIKETLSIKANQLWKYEKIAGVATAGIAHGALISDYENLPFIYVRSNPKKHGAKNQIEGKVSPGERCLVVEDLISTGGSSIAAVDVLRAAGAIVVGVIAIFTYELEKAQRNFDEADCSFTTISNYSALLDAVSESGKFTHAQKESLAKWRINPQKWSDEYC